MTPIEQTIQDLERATCHLRERLGKARSASRASLRQTARLAGLTDKTVAAFEEGRGTCSAETLAAIERAVVALEARTPELAAA